MSLVSDRGMRLLLIDDFALPPGGRLPLDGEVDALLDRLAPQLEGTVSDRLDIRERRDVRLQVTVRCLDDFAPDALLANCEAVRPWLQARQELAALPSDSPVRRVVAVLPQALLEDPFGRKLAALDDDGDDDGALRGLLSKVAVEEEPRQRAMDEIDRRLARQAVALIQAPWLRRVEAAWRSLEALRRQCQTLGVSLEVFSSPQDEVAERFFEEIFHDEYEAGAATPLAAVVMGYGFDRGQPSLETLETCARMGESLRVPFLAGLGAAFWGLKRQALLAGLPDLVGRLQGPEYVKWNRFRDDELSLWVALTANRFQLRRGWRDEGVSDLPWKPGDKEDLPLWGSGAWLLAVLVVRAYSEGGLRLPLSQMVLRDVLPSPGSRALEVALNEQRVIELGHCGLVPLMAPKGTDEVRCPLAPTFHRPRRFDRDDATRASFFAATLAHQLFACLASHRLQRVAEELELGLSDGQLEATFRHQMLAFLGPPDGEPEDGSAVSETAEGAVDGATEEATEDAVTVQVEVPPERPETRLVTVRLRPRFEVCGGRADLVLGTVVLVGSP